MDKAGGKPDPEWIVLEADGTARLPVALDARLGRGNGAYMVRVNDGGESEGDLISGVFSFASDYTAMPPAPLHIVTDKPLYQPGQTLHFAVLAMSQDSLQPLAGESVTVVIFDSRGNQVDRQKLTASENGIAAGTLPLSSDPNPGEWRIQAQTGAYKREITVTVKRYVRRRLEIQDNLSRTYFSPSRPLDATFAVSYFNGAPAANVKVTLTATCTDLFEQPRSFSTTTDSQGRAVFTTPPFGDKQDKDATVVLEAIVDDGGTPETWKREIPFHSHPVRLAILPEAGCVKPDAENRFLLSAWHPDGTPAPGAYKLTQRISKAVSATSTIVVGDTGWGEFTATAKSAPFALEVDGEGVPPESQFSFSPVLDLGIAATSGDWRPGGMVEGEVFFRHVGGSTPGQAELSLALPGGAPEPVSLTQASPGVWTFAAPIPRQAQGSVMLFAGVRANGNLTHTRRLALPVAATLPEITVTPRPPRVGPREKVTLDLAMTLTDRQAGGKSGAAVVTIADASILARANAAAPEDAARLYVESRQAAAAMPPPILQALANDSLPFFALPGEAEATCSSNNLNTLNRDDWMRYRTWAAIVVSAFLALGLAWIIVVCMEAMERDKSRQVKQSRHFSCLELMIVIAIIAVIAVIATPNLMQARMAGDPGNQVSSGDRAQAVARMEKPVAGATKPHQPVREWFPETLAFFPEVSFDAEGRAQVKIETADNLTRWHAGAVGLAASGGLQAGGADFWTEKPFFLEADFPVAFIAGDQPNLRVALFHTIDFATADIVLEESDAYACDEPRRKVGAQELQENRWLVFTPRFLRPGEIRVGLTAIARDAEGREVDRDVMSIPVTVTARGREVSVHNSGVLSGKAMATATLALPEGAINRRHELRVYPTPLSEYLNGVEALLRIPTGCFEQTASANYPNIFIHEHLKKTPNANPVLLATAKKYVQQGYQRLLSFEVSGGGFSLYGRAPADPWLTAYGLMHFHDLAKVIPVDPAVIRRTQEFLNRKNPINEVGAYAAWAVAESSGMLPYNLRNTAESCLEERESVYARLTGALALLTAEPGNSLARKTVEQAIGALAKGIPPKSPGLPSSARGLGAETELIALAILAGQKAELAIPGILYEELGRRRSSYGGWPGTQATVLALKALTEAHAVPCNGAVIVSSGGVELGRHRIDENAALFLLDKPQADSVQLRYEGTGRLSFLVSALGELRWSDEEMNFSRDGLNVRTALNRTEAALGEEIVMTVELDDRGDGVENPIVEIGLGAACIANPSALDGMVADPKSGILRYEVRDKGVTLYLASLPAGGQQRLRIPLTAVHAGRYTLPATRAWEYYRPENADTAAGISITVR